MLSRNMLLRQQMSRLTFVVKHRRCASQLALDQELTGSSEVRLSPIKPKKPTREPFAKNLFLGQFDVEFLTYPEPQTHERHREFFEWLKPIELYVNERIDFREIDRSSKIPNEVFEEFRKLGVFRAAVSELHGGLGLNNTEYAKLVETVSAVPVLGTLLVKRASIVNLINKFGTDEQKSSLLPKIASGELRPSLCFSESPTGSMSEPLIGTAMISDCREFFTLNAEKTWVVDAKNANLFIVLVRNMPNDKFVKMSQMGAFIVSSDSKGITISEPMQIMGQRGTDFCSVSLKDVKIPVGNQLGKNAIEADLFVSALGEGKHNTGGQAIGILKRFLNLLTTNIREGKNFNSKKVSDLSLQETIGKVAASLYAMEAVTYLTTGMMDNFEEQDSILEQSLVESHCTAACIENVLDGVKIIGTSGNWMNEPFEQFMRDSFALNVNDRAGIDTKIFSALLGVQHAGVTMGSGVKKQRNPFLNPVEMFKKATSITFEQKLYLDENLHPTLRISAQSLESSVHNLRKSVENSLVRNGIQLMAERMELRRLADIMIEVYAMTSVCARASRSYCIGLRNSEHEVRMAMIYTALTYEKVNSIAKELKEGDYANGDALLKDIADAIFQKKSYFAEHPLERTY